MKNGEFIETAEKIYQSAPHGFMTFWKIREHLKTADVYDITIDGVRYLYATNGNRLVYYWSDDNQMIIDEKALGGFDILALHGKYSDSVAYLKDTHEIHSGIYQIYDGIYEETRFNDEYYLGKCDFTDSDFEDAFDVFNDDGGHMSMEMLKGFTRLDVFDKDLWVFVRDKKTHKAAGMGICIYDRKFRETELEWIGIMKPHQRKGAGRMLIDGIIKAAREKSDIIRVGGVADDFYYKCGFRIKSDKLLYIVKKGTSAGWWD